MLRIKDLNVHYKKVIQALRGVSIEVNEGEIVAIIGPNGAGKTTLLMTISGIIRQTSGTIEFLGIRTDKVAAHALIRLGLVQVPQGRMLFPQMTVFENLEMGAYVARGAKDMKERLEEVYSFFKVLEERKRQKAGTLSGGEQQMLAIGRALMARPKLLLLDEPSSGLAPLVVKELASRLTDLRERGITILLVEQNASLALRLAERAYILETGSIVMSDRASNLAKNGQVRKSYLGV